MIGKSVHHPTPQNFCADTTVYITKSPLKATHIQMGAQCSALCFFLFFFKLNNMSCRVFAIMTCAGYDMVVP